MSYDLRSALGWITVIAVVVSVASYVVSLAVSSLVLVGTSIGTQLATTAAPLYIEAYLLIFPTPFQVNVLLIVAISLVVFVASFIKAAQSNGGFLSGLRTLSLGSRPAQLPNWLSLMPLVASGILIIDLLLSFLQDLFGVSTGMLSTTDPNVLFASLALAPIAEEIGFRLSAMWLFMGVLIAVSYGNKIAQGSKIATKLELSTFFVAIISPGFAKERAGLPSIRTSGLKGISIPEWIGLALTSVVFGLYHILGGGGWGPGKFLTAALSGFALGIIYLAYGAYADILLHWFFDLNFYAFSVYPAFDGAFSLFGDLATLGAVALGIWAIIVGIYWLANRKPSSMIYPTMMGFSDPIP